MEVGLNKNLALRWNTHESDRIRGIRTIEYEKLTRLLQEFTMAS